MPRSPRPPSPAGLVAVPGGGRGRPRTLRWTKANKAILEAYVSSMKDLLGLADWTIIVDWEPSSEETCATVRPVAGQKRAVLNLGPSFLEDTLEDQRHTIVHELVHCHLFPSTELVRQTHQELLPKSAATAAWVALMANVEYATDGLADVLAPYMPLPSWPL